MHSAGKPGKPTGQGSFGKSGGGIVDKIVLDASVVLSWLDEGKEADAALAIHNRITEGTISAWAPGLLLVEVANILFWRKKFSSGDIHAFIETLLTMGISFDDTPDRASIGTLVHTMTKYRITSYDAKYLTLAQRLQCKLVSFDAELVKIADLVISP